MLQGATLALLCNGRVLSMAQCKYLEFSLKPSLQRSYIKEQIFRSWNLNVGALELLFGLYK